MAQAGNIQPAGGRAGGSQSGIALLIVLWVTAVLIVIVLSFSLMTRTESQAALSFKEGLEKKYLAEAAVQRGIMELLHRSVEKNQSVVLEGSEVIRVDGTPYEGQMGDERYLFRITNEAGKININALTDATGLVLKNLLMNLGAQEEDADTIVDSILDWKDADDLRRLHGAESDYYMTLPNPYKARNADFETLEELLLVKGMKPELLFGSGERKGLIQFLTLYSGTDRIDIATAPKEVLSAIPGMTAEAADRIIEFRKSVDFQGVEDIKDFGGNAVLMAPYIGAAEANAFTIEAVGHKGSPKKGRSIRAIVVLEGTDTYRYLYYKSPAETT